MSFVRFPVMLIYNYLMEVELARFFNCKVTIFPLKLQRIFETMRNTLFLVILSPTTFILAFGLRLLIGQMRFTDSRIFTLKDPFLIPSDVTLIF